MFVPLKKLVSNQRKTMDELEEFLLDEPKLDEDGLSEEEEAEETEVPAVEEEEEL